MNDISAFKRDLLRSLSALDEPNGLRIKEWLEEEVGYPLVHHSRLYTNLDDLVSIGLVRKETELNDRSNSYTLTRRGGREVVEQAEAWNEAVAHVEECYCTAYGGQGINTPSEE